MIFERAILLEKHDDCNLDFKGIQKRGSHKKNLSASIQAERVQKRVLNSSLFKLAQAGLNLRKFMVSGKDIPDDAV